ncbi:MAG: alpha/beta hydrolase [Bacteroidales bacterium]|nr:alpha/beta hydrolase [Bacteroidales bacterium]
MHFETSDEVELHFITYGEKTNKPTVLIHGLGADHEMWKPQIENYPKKGFFLIVPDMRGHGSSSKVNAFRIRDCARDICELLDHLEIKTANIVGVSMGGVIAQQFACDYPEKTSKLVITDSFSEVSSLTEKLAGWMQWLTIKIVPSLLSKSLDSAYKGDGKAEVRNYFKKSFARIDKKQLLNARKALNRFNITKQLDKVKNPVLVLVGDGFGKFALRMAKKTDEAIKDSKLKVLKGGSDPSNLVVPEKFDKEVINFLK